MIIVTVCPPAIGPTPGLTVTVAAAFGSDCDVAEERVPGAVDGVVAVEVSVRAPGAAGGAANAVVSGTSVVKKLQSNATTVRRTRMLCTRVFHHMACGRD